MKKICLVILATCVLSNALAQNKDHALEQAVSSTVTSNVKASLEGAAAKDVTTMLTPADATRILGEKTLPAEKTGAQQIAYTNKTHTATLYFVYDIYSGIDEAHVKYDEIKTANEDGGIKTLTGLGDEAYVQEVDKSLYFILARKGEKMIRLKLNKITPTTSLDALNAIAKRIVAEM